MTSTQRSTVIGVFEDHQKADRAVDELRRAGFRNDQIGVAARDPNKTDAVAADRGTNAAVGAATGAVAGAGVGGLVALGILAGVIPGIGPAIAAGTLGVILANAAGGAALAGLVGALVGLGIPEEEARYYEGEFKAGRTIVTVKDVGGRYDEAWAILSRHGAYNKHTPMTTGTAHVSHTASPANVARSTGSTATSTGAGDKTIRLHEEQLHAHKQPVQTGEVRVHKEVVTENKTLQVPVTREEVVIERHAVGNKAASAADIKAGQEIRIPVSEERVNVTKETVATEEVHVGKRKVQETEQVGGTVRKEQVRVEREGKVDMADSDAPKRNPKR